MGAHRLEADPLPYQINCKFGEKDYFAAVARCEVEKISQAVLIRNALRHYLKQAKAVAPAPSGLDAGGYFI